MEKKTPALVNFLVLIDLRSTEEQTIFHNLHETFESEQEDNASYEVLVGTRKLAAKISTYARMSGFQTTSDPVGDHYRVKLFARSCRCG